MYFVLCVSVCVRVCVCVAVCTKYTVGVVHSMYIQIWQFDMQNLADWQRIAKGISTMPS